MKVNRYGDLAPGLSNGELFLSLTLDLINVRSKQQLYVLVNEKLREHLGYTYATIFTGVVGEDGFRNYFSDIFYSAGLQVFCHSGDISLSEEDLKNFLIPEYCKGLDPIEVKLFDDNLLIARLVMLYNKAVYQRIDIKLLESLAGGLAKTLSKITDYDKFTQRETENEILDSLGHEMASLRDTRDLLKLVRRKLKQNIAFSDHFIHLISEDQKALFAYLQDTSSSMSRSSQFTRSIKAQFSSRDSLINKVIFSKEPYVFDLQHQQTSGDLSEHFQVLNENGIKRVIITSLYTRDRLIGIWCLCQVDNLPSSDFQSRLIKKVSSQLSVTIDNIRANESVLSRERESNLLLKLSEHIALIRNKTELFQAINLNLRKLFNFDDIVIMVFNEDRTYYSFLFSLSQQSPGYLHYQKNALKKNIYDDCCLREVIHSQGLAILDVEELAQRESAPGYIKFEFDNGIKEKIAICLKDDHKIIGAYFVNSMRKSAYSDHELKLIEGVSYHISIAVSNILANEEIARRQEEKAILLSLSTEIASLKTRNDLFRVVNEKIKKIFSITQFGIAKINDDHLTHSAFMIDMGKAVIDHADFEKITNLKYSINDLAFSSVIRTDEPVILNIAELAAEDDAPAYVYFWEAIGFKKLLCLALRVGGTPIGTIFFNILENEDDGRKYSLLKGVCSQVAVAVSNILASEEISSRVSERELLLSISTDLAAVRNHYELIAVITSRLKNQLTFTHTLIGIVNSDHSTFKAYITDPASMSKGHPDYNDAKKLNFQINDGVMDKVYSSSVPLVFDFNELKAAQDLPVYLKINDESGLKQAIITRFSLGGEVFGFWMLFLKNKESLNSGSLSLIGGLANQISVAVSNIMANSEIRQRENEKSLLLSFSNALASIRNKEQLAKEFSDELRKFGVIGNYSLRLLSADQKYHQMYLYDARDAFTEHPGFNHILTMQCDVNDGITNLVLDSQEPLSFNIQELNERKTVPPYVKWWREIGLIELTGLRVRLGEVNIGILWLSIPQDYDKSANALLLKSISSQIAIALSNIHSNEKVVAQLEVIEKYKQQLEEEKIYLREEIQTTHNYDEIIGNSKEMKKTFHMVSQVEATDSTVLILGETGTGKELIARAIHNNSPRKDRLMIKVNCATLPANLIESELFGHEKGSFTGATERRVGKFELADKGTLFLDEIGELPLELQVKLLRALQEKEIERIGGRGTIKVDVRIIAATNRDLEKEMAEGRFRSDLYYRINIFPISLPPLRSRPEDIPSLATHFLQRFSKKLGKPIDAIGSSAMRELMQYSWPGNIRELEHLIERSILLTNGTMIKEIQLPVMRDKIKPLTSETVTCLKTIDENERDHILNMLKYCRGRVGGEGGAAERLGVPKSTLNSKIKRLGIRREHLY